MKLKIRQLREERKMTMESLARLSGISRVNLRKLEKGETEIITVGTINKMAAALNVNPSELFKNENIMI